MFLCLPLTLLLGAMPPQEKPIPATPLVKPEPAQKAIPMAPLVQPGKQQATAAMPLVRPMDASAAEAYSPLEQEYRTVYSTWRQTIQEMSERENVDFDFYPEDPTPGYYPRFHALAKEGDLDARIWCLVNFQYDETPEAYRADVWLGTILGVIEDSRGDEARSRHLPQCLFGGMDLADWHDLDRAAAALERATPEEQRADVLGTRLSLLKWVSSEDEALAIHRAKEEERLLSSWPDSEAAARVLGQRFADEHLQKGMVAPQLVGLDVDGKELSLEDLRGRVVLIDFWGFW